LINSIRVKLYGITLAKLPHNYTKDIIMPMMIEIAAPIIITALISACGATSSTDDNGGIANTYNIVATGAWELNISEFGRF